MGIVECAFPERAQPLDLGIGQAQPGFERAMLDPQRSVATPFGEIDELGERDMPDDDGLIERDATQRDWLVHDHGLNRQPLDPVFGSARIGFDLCKLFLKLAERHGGDCNSRDRETEAANPGAWANSAEES
jgi:hypothetical protein